MVLLKINVQELMIDCMEINVFVATGYTYISFYFYFVFLSSSDLRNVGTNSMDIPLFYKIYE